MSRAFDTIDRGILLKDLKELLEPDILHLVSLLLIDVQLEVKYNNKLGKKFKPDIGSPQGDCASPIWFIFYLHKALKNSKLSSSRDIEIDTSHDHNYTKADKNKKITKVQKLTSFITGELKNRPRQNNQGKVTSSIAGELDTAQDKMTKVK